MLTTEPCNLIAEESSIKRKVKHKVVPAKYRWMIFYRFILAGIGGYILSALACVVLSYLFKAHPVDAVLSATMLAFIIYVSVFIWVFINHSTQRATYGVVIPSVLLFIFYWGLKGII